jgi:hypothetical protein
MEDIFSPLDTGQCPKCLGELQFKSDGLEEDYMQCVACGLQVLTPRSAELDILVELE